MRKAGRCAGNTAATTNPVLSRYIGPDRAGQIPSAQHRRTQTPAAVGSGVVLQAAGGVSRQVTLALSGSEVDIAGPGQPGHGPFPEHKIFTPAPRG